METSGNVGSEATRPTVEFVEDLVLPEDFPEHTGCRLNKLGPAELLAVAIRARDKSLLFDVVKLAGDNLAAADAIGDIDETERWRDAAVAIEDIWAGGTDPKVEGTQPPVVAMISARTVFGEPVL